MWRGPVEITALVGFALKTDLFARFRLGASGGELLVPPRSSARMRLKERRCQKAVELRCDCHWQSLDEIRCATHRPLLKNPLPASKPTQPVLAWLTNCGRPFNEAGWKIFRGPLHIRPAGHLLQQEKAWSCIRRVIRSSRRSGILTFGRQTAAPAGLTVSPLQIPICVTPPLLDTGPWCKRRGQSWWEPGILPAPGLPLWRFPW